MEPYLERSVKRLRAHPRTPITGGRLHRSRLPGIQYIRARVGKVIDIPGHYRHAMNKRRRRDQRITIRSRIRHMQAAASLCNLEIDRQHLARERWQQAVLKPPP